MELSNRSDYKNPFSILTYEKTKTKFTLVLLSNLNEKTKKTIESFKAFLMYTFIINYIFIKK